MSVESDLLLKVDFLTAQVQELKESIQGLTRRIEELNPRPHREE